MDREFDAELEREIDEEMGWTADLKKKKNRALHEASLNPAAALITHLKLPTLGKGVKRVLRGLGKVVFFPLISPLGYSKSFNIEGDLVIVKRSWQWRLIDGLLTRLLLTPVIVAIFLIAVVYSS